MSQAASNPFRAAVVGARRVRQGTGEYLARELHRAGCQVVGIVGTRPDTLEEARRGLAERHGIEARGYLTLDELLARERPDVVAICSPSESHLEALEPALRAGCHVLCEKPLFWDPELTAPEAEAFVAATAEGLVDLAQAHGRHLAVNTQWPTTLPAFRALHGPWGQPVREVSMWLGPDDPGTRAVQESASHLLSLLYALCGPAGELEAVEATILGPDAIDLAFTYAPEQGPVACHLVLRRSPRPPRPAAYQIDGRRVDREIALPGYTFSFVAGERRVPLRDPLALSVEAFLDAARAGRPPERAALVQGMRHLHRLMAAVDAPAGVGD